MRGPPNVDRFGAVQRAPWPLGRPGTAASSGCISQRRGAVPGSSKIPESSRKVPSPARGGPAAPAHPPGPNTSVSGGGAEVSRFARRVRLPGSARYRG
eukprot:13115636-Alexandrium_andersonii.AAC.1